MDTPKRKIIGLHGLAGSGKSVAASYLEQNHNFFATKFAAPLKNMIAVMLCSAGVCNEDNFLEYLEGDLKEQTIQGLGDVTPRFLMQTLGDAWGRKALHENFWVNIWSNGVSNLPSTTNVVVDDIRYTNEAAAVRGLGGYIIHIIREDRDRIPGDHPSEVPLEALPGDIVIQNDGSEYDLYRKLNMVIKSI